jgi:hypothetical protein
MHRCLAIAALLFAASLPLSSAQAQSPGDRIFHSGVEPAFVVAGHIGYPAPLAGATIEAFAGSHVATTLSTADGSYRVHLETRYLAADPLIEIVGYGRGTRTLEVWAGALGPLSRLQSLGSASGVSDSQDAFARLGPYSTAATAALHGFNGFARITDAATFQRATRASAPNPYLVYGLALIATGDLVLPVTTANTFAAVLAPTPAQHLYGDVSQLDTVPCAQPADSAYCSVALTLPVDAAVVPVAATAPALTYAPYIAYSSVLGSSLENQLAYRVQGAGASVYLGAALPAASTVSTHPQGGFDLARSDGLPYSSRTYFSIVNGSQVRTVSDTISIRVRPSYGPGGIARHATGFNLRISYPDNPEIPSLVQAANLGLPTDTAGEALHPLLAASLPSLAGGSFVMALPEDLGASSDGIEARFGYDIHDFASSTGTTRRRARSLSWNASGNQVNLTYGATQATLQLVNEEEPGVWRSITRLQATGQDIILVGLTLRADAVGWSAGAPPTAYQSRVNGQICGSPYGDLDQFSANAVCSTFGWIMQPGGVMDRIGQPGWGTWSYAAAPHAGKLLFQNNSATQKRGWERVRYAQGSGYVLENFVTGNPAPAITFAPASRLVRIRDY